MYNNSILVFIVLLCMACSNNDSVSEPTVFVSDTTVEYKTIEGVDENLMSLDVYAVPNSKVLKPVVIWVHGGGWAIGDKLNKMDVKVPFFRELGYVFISVNYRLSPFPYEIVNNSRIKHPDHINDVADAVKWVYDTIDLYGGDKENIVLLGHSAGAHLTALMGTDESLLRTRNINPSYIRGIGSFDTQAYDIPRAIGSLLEEGLYVNAFGDDENAQKGASPQYQIDNSSIIVTNWLFTERGAQTRKDILNDFITGLEAENSTTVTIDANAYTHEDINSLIGDSSNLLMTNAIETFLETCFN